MRAASPFDLDLSQASVPVVSAAFVAAAVWFYRTRYPSSSVPTSQAITVTISPQDQELTTREPGYDRLSLRETKQPNLRFNPTRIARLTRKVNNSGLHLEVVHCEYKMTFDSVTEGNQAIVDNLEVGLPHRFPIDVSMPRNIEWSTQNLGLLTKQLHLFWEALGDGQRCSNLTIQLPPVRLAEVTSGSGILAVTTDVLLPLNLRTLEWRGSREQLPMFFQDQPAFSTLTNLTIQSGLSTDDCKTLLYWGRGRLQSAAFQTIRDVDPGEVRVSLPPVPNRVQIIEMAALMSLAITSTVDIRPLLSTQMRFPAINSVTLKISDPGFDIWFCRQRLTTFGMRHVPSWNVHGRMSQD
ncbi:hypothetical protein C0989_008216 [Termitomyces sp. Mn162]|nr:hypothetical protein C0989_008216 [Termitomyces sp. Mn162]